MDTVIPSIPVVYDALHAWCRHARGETRGCNPEAMREATR